MMERIRTAFVPGAGLGIRLRPLTALLPKPLVPVFHKPLVAFALDNLIAHGVERFVINTHHCPEAYEPIFHVHDRVGEYRGREIRFVHEAILLETAGGIRNARAALGGEPFFVYNGDVLANLTLGRLLAFHESEGTEVTLLLRSTGGPRHVQFDLGTNRVLDIRGTLGVAPGAPEFLFTGAYVVDPAFVDRIPSGEIISVVPIFLDMLRRGAPIAGVVADDGCWADLGNRASYIEAHRQIASGAMRLPDSEINGWPAHVHPAARVAPTGKLLGTCAIGPGAEIDSDVVLEDCILWKNAKIASGSHLCRCIVRDMRTAYGTYVDVDF